MASIAHTPPKMDRSRTRSEEQRRGLSYRTKNTQNVPLQARGTMPLRFMGISDPKSTLKVLSLNNLTSQFFFSFGLLHRPMHLSDGSNIMRIVIELKQRIFMND